MTIDIKDPAFQRDVVNELLGLSHFTDPNDWPYRADLLKEQQYFVWAEICSRCFEQTTNLIKREIFYPRNLSLLLLSSPQLLP